MKVYVRFVFFLKRRVVFFGRRGEKTVLRSLHAKKNRPKMRQRGIKIVTLQTKEDAPPLSLSAN